MATLRGGCHCGKVQAALATARDPATLQPRACDCSFCRKHGAAWISDNEGELLVSANADDALREYRQGSGNARFLLCGDCGVLVAVLHDSGGVLRGAMNAGSVEGDVAFDVATAVSPQKLSAEEKTARWQQLWTPAVVIRA